MDRPQIYLTKEQMQSLKSSIKGQHNYSIILNATGEWIGSVRGVASAKTAREEWVESFGRRLGIGMREIRAERLPD